MGLFLLAGKSLEHGMEGSLPICLLITASGAALRGEKLIHKWASSDLYLWRQADFGRCSISYQLLRKTAAYYPKGGSSNHSADSAPLHTRAVFLSAPWTQYFWRINRWRQRKPSGAEPGYSWAAEKTYAWASKQSFGGKSNLLWCYSCWAPQHSGWCLQSVLCQ